MNSIPNFCLFKQLLLILLSTPGLLTSIAAQVNAIVYFKDSTQIGGTIRIVESEGRAQYEFFSPKTNETKILAPGTVRYFRLSEKDDNIRFFYPRLMPDSNEVFFEKLKAGRNNLYRFVDAGRFYLETEAGEFLEIPPGKPERIALFKQLLPGKLIGKSAYSDNIKKYQILAGFLGTSFNRYPSTHFGFKLGLGASKIVGYDFHPDTDPTLGQGLDFSVKTYQISFFRNMPVSPSGKWVFEFDFGLEQHTIESNHKELGKSFVYSGYGVFSVCNVGVRRYWGNKRFFPYTELGLRANIQIEEQVELAIFRPVPEGYQVEVGPVDGFFRNTIVSPTIRVGIEIPYAKSLYFFIESGWGIATDKLIEKLIFGEINLGINFQ